MYSPKWTIEATRAASASVFANKSEICSGIPAPPLAITGTGNLSLITKNKTIYGLYAKIELYQTKPIGLDAVEATYEVLFEDKMGKPVSDSSIIIANKTDDDASNRKFKVMLNLNPQIKSDTYFLLVIIQDTHETIL